MLSWIKNIFKNPKAILSSVIDSLDFLVPTLSDKIADIESKFAQMSPNQKAQWVVDEVQAWLKKRFNIND